MRLPAIVLNFKTYPEVLGKKGWDLAKRFATIADDAGASIVLCPPTTDLAHIAKLVHLPVFAQHVDAVEPGATTGWSPPEARLEAGVAGTLINHSERKVAWEEMAKAIARHPTAGACQGRGTLVVGALCLSAGSSIVQSEGGPSASSSASSEPRCSSGV